MDEEKRRARSVERRRRGRACERACGDREGRAARAFSINRRSKSRPEVLETTGSSGGEPETGREERKGRVRVERARAGGTHWRRT
jgi:hypothetical protein